MTPKMALRQAKVNLKRKAERGVKRRYDKLTQPDGKVVFRTSLPPHAWRDYRSYPVPSRSP